MGTRKYHLALLTLIFFTGCKKSNNDSSSSGGGQTPTTAVLSLTKAGSGSGHVVSVPAAIDCGSVCQSVVSPGAVLTLTATPAPGFTFAGWVGGGCSGTGDCVVTVNTDLTVIASFNDPAAATRTLSVGKNGSGGGTVSSTPAGIQCGGDCTENFPSGTVVTLSAAPDGASQFDGWSGGGCSGTGACVVSLGTNTVVTATFSPLPPSTHALSVSRSGEGGGTVTSVPAGIDCGLDCTETYASGSSVTLTATPDSDSVFTGWTGSCTGTGICTVSMTAARTVGAVFAAKTFALTVSKSGAGGGTIASSPGGINCGVGCSAEFKINTNVTLTATPDGTSDFEGWSGACTGVGSCVVSMVTAQTVNAHFTAKQTVMVIKAGSGLVTSDPAGINCGPTCSALFQFGQAVTLHADPAAKYLFAGWSGGGCSGTGSCVVTANSATQVNATFVPDYSGTWTGATQQLLPMTFVVIDNKVSQYSFQVGVSGCGVISSTVTFGTAIPISGNAFDSGGTRSFIKGTFSSVTQAAGSLKADLGSMCGVLVTVNWSANQGSPSFASPALGPKKALGPVSQGWEGIDADGNRVVTEKHSMDWGN